MLTAPTTSLIAGLHYQLLDTDARIDRALDAGRRRDFMAWCKKRATLSSRLQGLLLSEAEG